MSETYNFDLKERLAEEAYQMAWQRVYRLATAPAILPALSQRQPKQ